MGLIEALQFTHVGGAPQISIAATGYLFNENTMSLTGANGSKNEPFATIGGSTLDITGVLLNGGLLSVGGGKLGLGYSGNGAKVLVDASAGVDGVTNLGTIAIHGAYPGSASGFTYPGAGGALTVSAGGFINDDQIIIGAATNSQSIYGGAGGMLLTTGSATVLNAGTITIDGQSTGVGITAPGGTLSIGGQSFYNTGTINVQGASVAGGEGGVLDVSGNFNLNGEVYIHAGTNYGLGGAAYLSGNVSIGGTTPGMLDIGSSTYAFRNDSGSVTILGDTSLLQSGTILLSGNYSGITIASTGRLLDAGGMINSTGYYNKLTNNGYVGVFNTVGRANCYVVNNGSFVVNGGKFDVSASDGTGTFDISGGGTLGFFVLNQATVQFAATPGQKETIFIQDINESNFTLAGISDSAVLAIGSNGVVGVTTSGDRLTISTTSHSYQLSLAAPLPTGTQFTIQYTSQTQATYIGFILPGAAVPPAAPIAPGRVPIPSFGPDPASLFAGHLTP